MTGTDEFWKRWLAQLATYIRVGLHLERLNIEYQVLRRALKAFRELVDLFYCNIDLPPLDFP